MWLKECSGVHDLICDFLHIVRFQYRPFGCQQVILIASACMAR